MLSCNNARGVTIQSVHFFTVGLIHTIVLTKLQQTDLIKSAHFYHS